MDDNFKHPFDEQKVRFRKNLIGSKSENTRWIIIITLLSFFFSASLLFVSSKLLENINNIIAIFVVMVIIFIGIIFDVIGISVAAADEAPFHAMASRKYYGARQAIKLIRNANKVSSFCNDVVGDICGVISGTAGAMLVIRATRESAPFEAIMAGLVVSGTIAALTVGGKAVGKTVAIQKSNYIVYRVSVILQFIVGRINLRRQKNGRKAMKAR